MDKLIHTNSIESVWALLKRQIVGIHHFVSPKHLPRCVDEMSWRFNRRDMEATDRMTEGKKTLDPPLFLEMDFGEALARFTQT